MNRPRCILLFLLNLLLFIACSGSDKPTVIETDSLKLTLGKKGEITGFVDKKSGVNYLPPGMAPALLSIQIANKMLAPEVSVLTSDDSIINLSYVGNISAKIKYHVKETHLTLELISITNASAIDLVIWGPYPTTINKIIGETIGVVRGESFAIGLQALNVKTLGGYPWNENDCMPQIDIFEQNDLSDLSEKGKRHVLYRVEAAKPEEYGSALQAYCRNRNKTRVVQNLNHERYTAPAFSDGGIVGSKIAIFGCPVEKTLSTIGAIERAENLPHPQIDGQWGKTTPSASAAYIIMSFGIDDIESALAVTKKSGLRYLYHGDPFENWGHFNLKEKYFPRGVADLKQCVDIAKKENIMLGVHTLSNFITTGDPYVTPVPDKRLAKVGTSRITGDVAKEDPEIPIESPDFFNQYKNNHLKTAVIGGELIRYERVSKAPPWKLLNCQRGAFGTSNKNHISGTEIGKLADHGYKVFLTDAQLGLEVSSNIATLFNQTGLRQISFDGLEGNRSTGMGNYGEILFATNWFKNLSEDIKSHFIADASRTSHYFWHLYTRMNWGEPWYAGFRESQTDYRIKNQEYFKRNLMPGMLGWFKMTDETSIADIEWMLARSAAFDAGYAFVTSQEALSKNNQSEKVLKLLGDWEKVRMAGLLTFQQKEKMKDIKNEFSLGTDDNGKWQLVPIFSHRFELAPKEKQPGEPTFSTFSFANPSSAQTMHLRITADKGPIRLIGMELDNFKTHALSIALQDGESFDYSGGNRAVILTRHWAEKKWVDVDPKFFEITEGEHQLQVDCGTGDEKDARAKFEIRLYGAPETLSAQ